MRTLLLSVILVSVSAAEHADQAMVDVARTMSSSLKAGGIVLAVSSAGKRQAWVFGRPLVDATVAPERIRFEIGSVSKLFNAVLLARAVRCGQARFAEPIADLLPAGFRPADARVATITLLQLATHRSGLPRLPPNLAASGLDDPYAAYDEAALIASLATVTLADDPFSAVRYSNYGAGLLGHLLARRRGMDWSTALSAEVLTPAGLSDTTAGPDAALDQRLAQPYVGARAVPAWRFQALRAAGALRSSAADLLAFGEALLGAQAELSADFAELVAHTDDASGPGLFCDVDAQPTVYWHNGATNGSRAVLRLSPTDRRVEVVLINQAEADPQAIIAAAHPSPRPPAIEPPPGWERELPGIYRLADGAQFTLLAVAGELRVRLTGQPFLTVVCTGPDAWRWENVAARLVIERDADGRVSALALLQNGQRQRAVRTAEALPELRFPPRAELSPLVGVYRGQIGDLHVTLANDTVYVRLADQQALPVFALANGRFAYDVVDAELAVERDAAGAPRALVLHQDGQVLRFARQP